MIGIPTFGADGGKSGISTYLMALLRQWSNQVDLPFLDIYYYPDEARFFLPPGVNVARGAVPIDPFWRKPALNLLWHQLQFPWQTWRRRHKVVFLPAGNRRVSWWSPCPTVATVHDLAALHVRDKYDSARVTYVTKVLPALLRRQTHLIAVSECSKRDIVEHVGYPPERISVIYEAADHSVYYPRPQHEHQAYLRQHHPQITDRPYLIYIARIEHPGKNHVRLLRAFDRLKSKLDFPHRLVLAGSDWDRASEVHALHQQLRHRDDMVFLGFVPHASVPHLYGGAQALVFPSLFEGFGLPILEAMGSGIPVATSNRASLPEIAGPAALLFDPENEEELEGALRQLVENATLLAELREKGLQWAANFSWKKAADETMAVLKKVGGIS